MAVILVLGPYVCPFSVSNTSVFSSNAVTVNQIKINQYKDMFQYINEMLLAWWFLYAYAQFKDKSD